MGNLTKDTIEERIASVKTSSDVDDLDLAGDLAVAGQLYCSGTGNTRQALKVHNHLTTSEIGGAEFKGELINATGSLYGVYNTWDVTPTTASSAITQAIASINNVSLTTGKTITTGNLVGVTGQTNTAGILNGADVTEFGIIGSIAGAGAKTLCSHVAGVGSSIGAGVVNPTDGNLSHFVASTLGTTAIDNLMYVQDSQFITNVLNFEQASGCVVNTATGNSAFVPNNKGTFTQAGQLKIKIGNDTFYIPYGTVA